MRIRPLDIGVESVSRWLPGDEIHLPAEGRIAPAYRPVYRSLDSILNRPSLDERLPALLQPAHADESLLEPTVLSETRAGLAELFREMAATDAEGRRIFARAADDLAGDAALDAEIRAALAMLLRA